MVLKNSVGPISPTLIATMLCLQLCTTLVSSMMFSSIAIADDFPGTGSRSGWSEALPHYNVANKYMARGLYGDAAQHLEQAISLYGQDPDFYINYGVCLRKLESYPDAEAAFKKAISLRNNDWEAWSNLANANLKQNRLQETINCFEKAMKFSPPPAEKEAMLKDIADIKKILSMQAPPPVPGKAKTATTSKASTGTPSTGLSNTKAGSPARKLKGASMAAGNGEDKQQAQQQANANGASGNSTASSGSGNNAKSPASAADKKELTNSGADWGY